VFLLPQLGVCCLVQLGAFERKSSAPRKPGRPVAVFSYESDQGGGESFTHRATERGKKGRKKRGEVAL